MKEPPPYLDTQLLPRLQPPRSHSTTPLLIHPRRRQQRPRIITTTTTTILPLALTKTRTPLQLLNLPRQRPPPTRKMLLLDGHKPQEPPRGAHAERLLHVLLDQRRVTLVGRRLQLRGQRKHGHGIGRVEGPAEEHARAVVQRDHDGRDGPLVARREVVGELGYEGEFVADLDRRRCRI